MTAERAESDERREIKEKPSCVAPITEQDSSFKL